METGERRGRVRDRAAATVRADLDPAQFKDRDVVARAFADLYRTQHQEFPPECRDADYEKRIKAAYPIHPEIFDRLYADWSDAGQVPAHPRRVTPHGCGNP